MAGPNLAVFKVSSYHPFITNERSLACTWCYPYAQCTTLAIRIFTINTSDMYESSFLHWHNVVDAQFLAETGWAAEDTVWTEWNQRGSCKVTTGTTEETGWTGTERSTATEGKWTASRVVIGNSIAFCTTQADVTDDIRGNGTLYLKHLRLRFTCYTECEYVDIAIYCQGWLSKSEEFKNYQFLS